MNHVMSEQCAALKTKQIKLIQSRLDFMTNWRQNSDDATKRWAGLQAQQSHFNAKDGQKKRKSRHLQQNHHCQRLQRRNKSIQFKRQVAGYLDPSSQDERMSGVRKESSEVWRATQNATTDSLCYFNPNMNPVTVSRSRGRSRSSADSPRSSGFLPGCPSLSSEQQQRR